MGRLTEEQERDVIDALCSMVGQHCYGDSEEEALNSGCLSANAEAIRALESIGLMKVVNGDGRCLKAVWVDQDLGTAGGTVGGTGTPPA